MKPLNPTSRRRLLEDTVTDLTAAITILGPSLALIHDAQNGHPRAARYDADTTRHVRLWCFTHERDHQACEHDALPCGGTPITTVDPTGDAATTPDPAAAAQRHIDKTITALAAFARALTDEIARWQPPSTDMQRPDPTAAVAPDGWCTSCWRNDKKHEPISTHYAGTLCRFCGSFKKREGQLPTVPILELHHQGRNIYQHFVDEQLRRPQSRRTA
jgi:hypothetical protein